MSQKEMNKMEIKKMDLIMCERKDLKQGVITVNWYISSIHRGLVLLGRQGQLALCLFT